MNQRLIWMIIIRSMTKKKRRSYKKKNIFKYAVIFRQCLFTKFLIK